MITNRHCECIKKNVLTLKFCIAIEAHAPLCYHTRASGAGTCPRSSEDRATASEAVRRRFDSCRGYQKKRPCSCFHPQPKGLYLYLFTFVSSAASIQDHLPAFRAFLSSYILASALSKTDAMFLSLPFMNSDMPLATIMSPSSLCAAIFFISSSLVS